MEVRLIKVFRQAVVLNPQGARSLVVVLDFQVQVIALREPGESTEWVQVVVQVSRPNDHVDAVTLLGRPRSVSSVGRRGGERDAREHLAAFQRFGPQPSLSVARF